MSNPSHGSSRLKHGLKTSNEQAPTGMKKSAISTETGLSSKKNLSTPKQDNKQVTSAHTTGSSLKSSVKRLFSPGASAKNQHVISNTPSGTNTHSLTMKKNGSKVTGSSSAG